MLRFTHKPSVHWVNFIRNLDELDLEQLEIQERLEVFQAFAPNPQMQIYGRGIRRRIAPILQGNFERLKMVFRLLFALPGTPLIAYGDEIGMGDNLAYSGRQAVRTPMQWSGAENGGFSSLAAHEIPIPPIDHGIFCYSFINVEDQLKDSDSLLNKVKELISIRKDHKIIGQEKPAIIQTKDAATLGLKYEKKGEELLIFINLSSDPKVVGTKEDLNKYTTILL